MACARHSKNRLDRTATILSVKSLSDLQPDPRNANKGTERGRALLEQSLRSYGAGRSITVDRDGVVIAGSKTLDVAVELGLGMRVVDTDGKDLVVVRRTDLSMEDREARELAIADNRVAEVDLSWDVEVLRELADEGVRVGEFFTPGEMPEAVEEDVSEEKHVTLTFDAVGHSEYTMLVDKLKEQHGVRSTSLLILMALRRLDG
jgi:hypothetical protein